MSIKSRIAETESIGMWKSGVIALVVGSFMAAAAMGIAELGLRFWGGRPEGVFWAMRPGKNGLYPENTRITMVLGAAPYMIHANSYGFRGPAITYEKPPSRLRIAAIGDSITDGFYVDDPATYPAQLEQILRGEGVDAEVLNAAHGGGSINKELAILRKCVLPLRPDVVILTFVTNDISDIEYTPRENLVRDDTFAAPGRQSVTEFLLTKTALGEFVFDMYMRLRSPAYRGSRARAAAGVDRYKIPGGSDFVANARHFDEWCKATDGLVLHEPFSPKVEALLDNYIFALQVFRDACSAAGARLLFVYFPAYSQVYLPGSSSRVQQILGDHCARLGIPFLDLTQTFREQGRDAILHLAPLDYHLNPDGNKVMAGAIGDYLHRSSLLQGSGRASTNASGEPIFRH